MQNQKKYKDIIEKNLKNLKNRFDQCQDLDLIIEQEIQIDQQKFRMGPDGICGIKFVKVEGLNGFINDDKKGISVINLGIESMPLIKSCGDYI